MVKIMSQKQVSERSCYGCKFALEASTHPRHGEQVRCMKAEELFGGTRWVNVMQDNEGNITESQCGTFEPFYGDDSEAPEPPKEMVTCKTCNGKGSKMIQFMEGPKFEDCVRCKGTGKVEKGGK